MSTKKNEEKSQVSEVSHETLDWLFKHDKDFLMSYYVLLQFYDSLSAQFTPKKWKDGRVLLTPKKQTNETSSKRVKVSCEVTPSHL